MLPIRLDARPFASAHAPCDRRAHGLAGNGILLAWLVGPLLLRRPMECPRKALFIDAEGPDLRRDRRHHCRPHHITAGAAWWGAQLGLSLLLAARRDFHADGLGDCRLPRGGAGVGTMAPPHRG